MTVWEPVDDELDDSAPETMFFGDSYFGDDLLLHQYMEDEYNHDQFEPTDY